ncbi:methyltransferase type 12 [Thalassospira profundimaris]|uniref:Methyltransferase type 12 n=1 Tax=Thalassospira profundimaris TaxID=502049 RepID=A0A367XJX0_9PROT|nr:class I SAM-dependent methyltransferase [Thalassospira profundimaris]RCK53838.1 methyltransferase type 12 [Thalassospira profundimaris]
MTSPVQPDDNGFYPEGGLNVASYDLRAELDRKLFDDPLPFYRDWALETGGPVLELGCGTGRIAGDIARQGIAVEGLDLSAAMLAQARRNYPDVTWHQADMCDFDLGRSFALVIIPFRGLQEVTTASGQRAALSRAFAHLKPGGRLVFDLIDPDLRYCLPEGDAEIVQLPLFPMPAGMGATDSRLRITAMERTNTPLTQQFCEHWRFEEIAPDGTVRHREDNWHSMRWVHRAEMALMLELCGFISISEYSGFRQEPPRYAANQVWVAQRPA